VPHEESGVGIGEHFLLFSQWDSRVSVRFVGVILGG
jgi:hypothetical protein